jgi:hypothetical protein
MMIITTTISNIFITECNKKITTGSNNHCAKSNTLAHELIYILLLDYKFTWSMIWGFHGGKYEEGCLLGCSTV